MATKRLDIKKTYKLYIDGKFPRSESGRYYTLKNKNGEILSNICRGSKKDLRDAIVSNRKAQEVWASRTAYNKGQILYRIAETLESRKSQFIESMVLEGYSLQKATDEIISAIDLIVYYAGWSDKYIQVFSTVNPVESSHFNFSYPEAMGVIVSFPNEGNAILSMLATTMPAIIGGNTITILNSSKHPMTTINFAEVLQASDVPSGVINIITCIRKDVFVTAAQHMDINAIVFDNLEEGDKKILQINASSNLKRVIDYTKEDIKSPYRILSCQEIKTTWHPIGK